MFANCWTRPVRKFSALKGLAAPILETDIDTDIIFPARFLLLLSRQGIGQFAFHGRRNDPKRDEAFVLDQPQYKGVEIIVTGERFGVGSSREHAVWALSDFGIKCIIAPSFGDIFHANCLKNGLLPITLETPEYAAIKRAALDVTPIEVDLQDQCIRIETAAPVPFDIDTASKQSLLNGLDEVDKILAEDEDAITAFEKRQKELAPWLWL